MSLAMHRAGFEASSNFARGINGAALKVTPNVPWYTYPCLLGTTASSSYKVSSSRKTKQGQCKDGRVLPNGPGPLPNRPTLNKGTVKFVASRKSSAKESPTTRRKVSEASNESGYESSGEESSFPCNHVYGDSNGRKWKSLNQLPEKKVTTSSSSYKVSSSRKTKQGQPTAGRVLPNGPGPLPNRPTLGKGKVKFVASSANRTSGVAPPKSRKSSAKEVPTARRKPYEASNDSGYESSGEESSFTNNHRYGDLNVRKWKSLNQLPGKDETNDLSSSSYHRSRPSPTGRGNSDGLVGLRNLGNTCFMNSILQCLSHTPRLTEHLLRGLHTKNINSNSSMKGKLIQAFAELIKSMWKPGNSDAESPHTFKTQIQRFAPRFMGYNQQDAQEFLRFLLEGLHDDLNQVRSKPKYTPCEFDNKFSHKENAEKSWKDYLSRDNSLMTDLFVGQLKSMLTCCTCGYQSVTFDPFWDLSLPIPRKSGSSSYSGRRSSGTDDGVIDISDCMLSFTKEEILDGDERPTCGQCKVKRKSTKKFSIQRLPPILVLHLKRFSGFSFRSKLQSNVDFPMKLDLADFSADPQEHRSAAYSLYAVSNHSGSTYGGHYTAYCKHPVSNEWHCFNDSRVDSLSSSRVRGSQAYILFYEKVERKSSL